MSLKRWIQPISTRSKTFFSLLGQGCFKKAANYLLTNINMVIRPEYVFSYPTILIIDPGNICNLSCALCITGQKKSLRPPKLLALDDFKKIIDQLGKWAIQLDLYNWGEPFLNKDVFKMISYAKKADLRVELSSNLNYFNPQIAEETVRSGLDRLILSLHGATKKTTQKYMKGSNFNKVIKNLKLLMATKKRLKSKNPSITWRYVVCHYNELELEKADKLSKTLGVDYFEPVPLKLDVGFDPLVVKNTIKKHGHWLPKNEKYRGYDPQAGKLLNNPKDCFWPWEIVAVNADATIQPCCVFTNPSFDFGNILKTPFRKIWNGRKYQTARKVIKEKIKTDKTTVCGLCVATDFIAK